MIRTFLYFFMFLILFIFNSCWYNKKKPNFVYMPDMYYADTHKTYSDPYFFYKKNKKIKIHFFDKNKTTSLHPVQNTIPRDDFYDPISKLSEIELKKINHYPFLKDSDKTFQEGKKLYQINCSICHGDQGNGQGILVKNEKILGIPDYKDRKLSVGGVYYVITYGKNNMSSYASQLNRLDRWKVSKYVMFLKNKRS